MAPGRGMPMTWPPSELQWDEILGELPAEARASTRAAVDAAVHEYLSGSGDPQSSAERAQMWQHVERLADSKSIAAFREAIRKLGSYKPLDPEAKWLLELADQLVVVPKKPRARALLYRPRSKKRGELHPLLAKLVDLPHDLFDRSLAAVQDGTQLDRGSFDDSHCNLLERR